MSTTPTKLNIMNSALRKVGSFHLEASDTTSATYEVVNQAYLDAVLEIFSENVFNYNTKKATLTAVNSTATTNTLYEYYYTLPTDFNFLNYITNKESTVVIRDYAFYDNQLHTNEKEICMYYTFIPDLSSSATALPPFLNRLLVLHIAYQIAIELSGSENRHEILRMEYEKALKRARVMDARQGAAQTFVGDYNSRIIEAHQRYGKI